MICVWMYGSHVYKLVYGIYINEYCCKNIMRCCVVLPDDIPDTLYSCLLLSLSDGICDGVWCDLLSHSALSESVSALR